MIYCDAILLYHQARGLGKSGSVPPFLLYVFMGCAGGKVKVTNLSVTSRKTKICPNNGYPSCLATGRNATSAYRDPQKSLWLIHSPHKVCDSFTRHKRVCDSFTHHKRVCDSFTRHKRVCDSFTHHKRVCDLLTRHKRICDSFTHHERVCDSFTHHKRVCDSFTRHKRVCGSFTRHKRVCDSFTHTTVLCTVRYSIIRLVYVMETVAIHCLEETEFSCSDSDGQRWIDALRSVLCMLQKSKEVQECADI